MITQLLGEFAHLVPNENDSEEHKNNLKKILEVEIEQEYPGVDFSISSTNIVHNP